MALILAHYALGVIFKTLVLICVHASTEERDKMEKHNLQTAGRFLYNNHLSNSNGQTMIEEKPMVVLSTILPHKNMHKENSAL